MIGLFPFTQTGGLETDMEIIIDTIMATIEEEATTGVTRVTMEVIQITMEVTMVTTEIHEEVVDINGEL